MCNHESQRITSNMSYVNNLSWHEWMTVTHKQTQCDVCGLWVIWKWKGIMRKKGSYKHSFRDVYERDLK